VFTRMRLIIGFIYSLGFAMLTSAAELPPEVKNAFIESGVPLGSVSIVAKRIDQSSPLLTFNSDVPRNPASVMKLVTSYAALDLLGPTYRWKTQLYSLTEPLNGKITEGIWVKGSGDPNLDDHGVFEMASELTQKYALQEVCCTLNFDLTAYASNQSDPGAFDGKPFRVYNASAEAIMVNQQALRLQFIPSQKKITVIAYPFWHTLQITTNIKPIKGECSDWKSGLQIERVKSHLNLSGVYPISCENKYLDVNWQTGSDFFAELLNEAWLTQGVKSSLQNRVSTTPQEAVLLTEHLSAPLSETLVQMNKTSNNVMARALYLTLGRADDASQPMSTDRSELVLKGWIAKKGWHFSELVVENGSGLSRHERISALHLSWLLEDAFHGKVMPEIMASLPIYGLDGSLIHRDDPTLVGVAHLKTGSLENVRSLAGYLVDAKGRYWTIVLMINAPKANETKAAQDALLSWIYHQD
jgi:serine-type D-Ala-D-Ala carboxypeptidase/endopeptidase (penicillin-binding protein 4)